MAGIHHVTAIAGRADRNLDFFTRVLGLRLVKKTVNFDDPGTYHLYYGDHTGQPGTVLTFFPWEHATPGRGGVGLAQQTLFRVPSSSIGYWTHRFIDKGVVHEGIQQRFGEPVLPFTDPDGLSLALVGVAGAETEPAWGQGEVPAGEAIRGFHGVTLMLADAARTGAILTDVLAFSEEGRQESLIRFRTTSPLGAIVDLREAQGFLPGTMGHGTVHHVAFRAPDDAAQAAMARRLVENHGMRPTSQMDRQYFRSIYFREPGGVLFEIATDEPGFAVDEPVASLGRQLKLPPFLEPKRRSIEAALPPLKNAA